jgi:D-alanyl-D-alanine carboxypeptidase
MAAALRRTPMMLPIARRLVALACLLTSALAVGGLPQTASAQLPYANMLFSEPRYAAVVVDANSGEVLYEKHPDGARYPASITKVMTLYLTFEALTSGKLKLEDRVPFSSHASAQSPSKLDVRPGDSISVEEAIMAMTTLSANDAAVAMAEKIGGSEARFATLMTLRAQELGMRNTQFVNANGLPDSRQISTARDIAIMSRAVMRDFPQFYHYFGEKDFQFRGRRITSHNHMLSDVPGVDGLKTGYINASGFNIAISGVRDGRRLIVVVLGGPSRVSRDQNAADLLYTGFDVMARRAKGEVTTVAQNLFEPDLSGPVVRPPTEQGDADQRGLQIVLRDEPRRPLPAVLQPVQYRPAVDDCVAKKVVTKTKKKHGRKVKVTTTTCRKSGKLTRASATSASIPCGHTRTGHRAKASACGVSKGGKHKKHGKGMKVAASWQVQMGASLPVRLARVG